jgi:hypothetical protein
MSFPKQVHLKSNTTPVTGDIAGQLLQVNVTGTSTSIKLGPVKDYVPQGIYFKAGTSLTFVADQRNSIYNQTIVLKIQGTKYTFYGLLGSNSSTVVVNTPYNSTSYSVGANLGNYGPPLTVNYPIEIVNEQEWEYGGVPVG